MSWIVKNSAEQEIERRDEPYLDEQLKTHFDQTILPRYPTRRAALLPVLHEVQHKYGWIPHQAMEEVADFLGLRPAEVLDTISFYEEFWTRPKGEYLVQVCQSISCELLGQRELIEQVQKKLGIGVNETTDDGKFTLMAVECLGSCGTAPCALVNERLHENVTHENLDTILDSLE